MIPFTADFPGYIEDPDLGDKMHCVVFVIDGCTVDEMPDKVYKQIKDIRIKVNHRGNFGKNHCIYQINKNKSGYKVISSKQAFNEQCLPIDGFKLLII